MIKDKILSYDDFKKLTLKEYLILDTDSYSDDEIFNILQWSKQSEEELFNARNREKIISENVEIYDELTDEEENTPIQDLIDKANKRNIQNVF